MKNGMNIIIGGKNNNICHQVSCVRDRGRRRRYRDREEEGEGTEVERRGRRRGRDRDEEEGDSVAARFRAARRGMNVRGGGGARGRWQ